MYYNYIPSTMMNDLPTGQVVHCFELEIILNFN